MKGLLLLLALASYGISGWLLYGSYVSEDDALRSTGLCGILFGTSLLLGSAAYSISDAIHRLRESLEGRQ